MSRVSKSPSVPMSEYKTTPYPFQQQVTEATRDHYTWALFLAPRLGKTKITLDTAAHLYRQGKINCVVVVCAKQGIHRQWIEDECPEHMAVEWAGAYWTSNAPKRRGDLFTRLLHTTDRLIVVTWYVAAVNTNDGFDWLDEFLRKRQCLFVLDESAMMVTHPKAKQTRRLQRLSKLTLYKRILDGHPEAESPFEYFGQFRFLSPKILGDNFTEFKAEYGNFWPIRVGAVEDLETGQKVGGRQVKVLNKQQPYQNLDILYKRIAIRSTRLRRSDVAPDLPQHQYGVQRFELSKLQDEYYRQMRDEYLLELRDAKGQVTDVIYAELVISRRLRLAQIACGYIPVDGEPRELIDPAHNPRLDALAAALEDLGRALIWHRFTHDADLILDRLGERDVAHYTGSDDRRAEAKRLFLAGAVPWFVGNPAVAGVGLTFKGVPGMVFYSNYESGRIRFQAEDRPVYLGQTESIYVCDVLAADTVDEVIVKGLQRKYQQSQQAPSTDLRAS